MNRTRFVAVPARWQLALFIALHALIFTWLFHYVFQIHFAPSGLFFQYASKALQGQLPYRDFPVEYPPGALLFFLAPRLVTSTWPAYARLFEVEVFLADVVALVVLYRIECRRDGSAWRILGLYTLAVLAMGPTVAEHFDLIPAVMALVAVHCFWLGMDKTSWALLGVGTMTKAFPVLLAPLFLINYLHNRQYGRIWRGVLAFTGGSVAVLLPFLVVSPGSLLSLYRYHARRGIQIESTYGSILLLGEKLKLWYASPYFAFGSWNVAGHVADALARASPYVLAALLLAVYWQCLRQTLGGEGARDIVQLATQAALVLLVGLIGSKVLSPQYLIWLIPFLPLIAVRERRALWVAFVVAGAVTYYIFPLHYDRLVAFDPALELLLFARNLLLVALALMVAKALLPRAE